MTTNDQNVNDPRTAHREEGYPQQSIPQPGLTEETVPEPDHGEASYVGTGRLQGRKALVTGGDSGIGRAVAIAYAREGADVAFTFVAEEEDDAADTAGIIEDAGVRAVPIVTDQRLEDSATASVETAVEGLGGLDVLVLNAGYQRDRDGIENLTTEDIDEVFHTNLYGTLWTLRASVPKLPSGASIIITSSIQAYHPSPRLLDYAMTKAALVSLTKSLAQELGPRGIRVNSVAPGPIWTPLIPGTGWEDKLPAFGKDTPLGRAGQPAELASTYVYLAENASSYTSGAIVAVTGGKHLA